MEAVDRGEGASGWAVALMMLVPAVTPSLVELVRRVAGHHASPASAAGLGFCVLVLAVGLRAPLRTLRPDRRRSGPVDGAADQNGAGADLDTAPVWGLFGFFCLVGATVYAVDGVADPLGGPADPLDMHLSAVLLGGLGLAALVGVVLHGRRRPPAREPEGRHLPAPSPPATGRGWWAVATVGAAVAVLLLWAPLAGVISPLHASPAGTPPIAPMWTFVVDVATVVTWVAGTVAVLRTAPQVTVGPGPDGPLDAAERRALDEASALSRPVEPALRPRLRALLVRDLHQWRRGVWLWVAFAFQGLDEAVDDLANHTPVGPIGTARLVLGVFGFVVLPGALLGRHRAARRLAAWERSG